MTGLSVRWVGVQYGCVRGGWRQLHRRRIRRGHRGSGRSFIRRLWAFFSATSGEQEHNGEAGDADAVGQIVGHGSCEDQ